MSVEESTRAPTIAVGDRFDAEMTLSRQSIADFAHACGDANPIHVDDKAAHGWGFDDIIASGPHTSALFGALLATYFVRFGQALGLELHVRFLRPVTSDAPFRIVWEIIGIARNEKLRGYLVSLSGRCEQNRAAALSGSAKVVVRPRAGVTIVDSSDAPAV
ncbi:MaoC family dehydratase [Methylocystis sp. MJC1]|jgi:acyl dehydratase|uniref:MaoC family dehydratase n=1 Tax=Methylocystis sp. MJC1 TaxID=2654282 RepID=UPI0013EB5304|nr:MaoC family dehydratase [Methylocystis sp. MJC1]KAF2991208.1 hypothetical protein MJC1_01557 [Methylocystis sp. MJC1]MBU6526250.1 MaoC family dehydratase [Methylocystis sp. MJC1]UZX12705.1 MaoC family dehydratase [Methylocystis sp. MJC1]